MPGEINAIAKAIQEGLSLWKTFIATRQEAYYRQQDKRKSLAIDAAENYIILNEEINNCQDEKERNKKISKLDYWKVRFFKFNQ